MRRMGGGAVPGECRRLYNRELPAVLLTKYYSDDYLSKSEMGEACGTHGRE